MPKIKINPIKYSAIPVNHDQEESHSSIITPTRITASFKKKNIAPINNNNNGSPIKNKVSIVCFMFIGIGYLFPFSAMVFII